MECVAVVLALAAASPAQEPVGDAQKRADEVARLIAELDADTRSARVQAERELLRLGPDVLPLLPPPELLPNVSVREAVRRIRIELERRKARESVQPSRVTLHAEKPLRDLLQTIAQQTGNPLDMRQLSDELLARAFRVDYDEATFWTAMDDLAARAGVRYDRESAAAALVLQPRPDDAPQSLAVQHAGAFRVALRSAEVRPLVGSDEFRLLRFRLGLMVEPRLRPLFLDLAVKDTTAAAPSLGTLEPFTPGAKYELPLGDGSGRLNLQLDYKVPITKAVTQARLSGTMTVLTAAGTEAIAFDNLAKSEGVARRRGGVTAAVQQVRTESPPQGPRRLLVRVAVAYDTGGPAFESHRTWMFHNQVYLLPLRGDEGGGVRSAADGPAERFNTQGSGPSQSLRPGHPTADVEQRIEPDGFTTELQTDGGVAVEYEFRGLDLPPDELRFVYVAPTLLIRVPVAFDFEAVPVQTDAE